MKISYKTKILLSLLLVSGIIFWISFSFFYINFKKTSYADATKMVDAYVRENANQIVAEFNIDMGVCRALASSVASSQQFHNTTRWQEHTKKLAQIDKDSRGYLNVWVSFELSKFRKGYDKDYGRRVLNVYTINGQQLTKDYFNNLDGDIPESAYYKIKISKKEAIVEPYLYSLTNSKKDEQLVTSICVPILLNDEFIGLSGVDIGLERFQKLTDRIKPFEKSYAFLVAYDGTIITHPDKSLVNKKIQDEFSTTDHNHHIIRNLQNGSAFSFINSAEINEYFSFAPILIGKTKTPWSLVTVTPERIIYANSKKVLAQTILLGLVGFIVLGILIWLIISRLIGILKKYIAFTEKVNKGILNEEIDIQRDDELGELAKALMDMTNSLRTIVNQLKISSKNISEASELLNNNSQGISLSARKQAAEVEEISSSLDQMASFINQNAENSKATEKIALLSKDSVIGGSKASEKATLSIKEIVSKNSTVSDIAFQTNILALNAAVEAARAGEQGLGFSVVASEVQKLAERSKDAAEEINQLTEIILYDSEDTNNKLKAVIPEIEKTTTLVQNIATSSKEQSEGVGQINVSIHLLNDITQNNASSAENLAVSAEELSAQAEQLEDIINSFKS